MHYAYCINAGDDFNAVIDLACEAEQAGWDGFFVPDGIAIDVPNMAPFRSLIPGLFSARSRRVRPVFVSAL
jgi:alkanesulfonate monooxygenase SsuD/methylene tetrahydromethanopterin reductase-like flavin-dependent oxidoreductase (luciferase family)